MFLGCDTDAARGAADTLASTGTSLSEIADGLDRAMVTVTWEGADADAFGESLHGRLVPGLRTLAERWGEQARVLRDHADEQDQTSAADAPAGGTSPTKAPTCTAPDPSAKPSLLDRYHEAFPLDEGPSRGFFVDALGERAGHWAEEKWVDESERAAKKSRGIGGLGRLEAMLVDAANIRLGDYEAIQGVRDGDATEIADGLITTELAKLDLLCEAAEVTPLAPYGVLGSAVTGTLGQGWATLRRAALEDEAAGGASRGSPTRYLLQTPRRANEDLIQPLAEEIGGPAGESIGTAGDDLAGGEIVTENLLDAAAGYHRDLVMRVPGAKEALEAPRRIVEAPRHAAERVWERW